ncbi:MAG: oxygenase MpaB family protein [Bacteroidota bacterium]
MKIEDQATSLTHYRFVGDGHFAELLHAVNKRDLKQIWELNDDEELFGRTHQGDIQALIDQVCTLPSWINQDILQQSAIFFQKNMLDLSAMLGLASLPYCYAGADGAQVLVKTGRIVERTQTRLLETGKFVFDVSDINAFSGTGSGFLSCLKVRIVHQFVRDQMLQNGWDTKTMGYPVNQLDQALTNLSFSLIAIRAIRQTGKTVSDDDAQSYLQRWNAIAVLLGLDEALIKNTMRTASHLARSIEKIQFRPSEAGSQLTAALVKSLIQFGELTGYSKRMLSPYMAYLLGDKVADCIGLEDKGASNLFEFSALLKQLKSVFRWIPVADLGPVGDRPEDPEFEKLLVDIPMLIR